MENNLPEEWLIHLEKLDIAFQPVLNIHTGKLYAVEALLRNFRDTGFKSIFEVFDRAYQEGILYTFDLALREKTLKKFTQIKNYENIRLFYNIDNRLFDMPNFSNGNTHNILKKLGIKKENLCFEISERHEISHRFSLEKVLSYYKENDFSIAIDDFGVGYSGYKLLFDSKPDLIKIDRFFLQEIEKDIKKQLMVRSITHLAIQLGIQVVAEGVETKAELLTCKDIGCHLVQGYLAQRPTKNTNEILPEYQNIIILLKEAKRNNSNREKIKTYVQEIEALHNKVPMSAVIDYFKKNKNFHIVPVVNANSEPIGVLYEDHIKEYLYSPYGMSLLLNAKSSKSKLKNFISTCTSTDINSDIETIIELFSNNPKSSGIIITNDSKYYGFLSARAIISIMNEENLIVARDQNPLTKLPGNRMIEKYVSEVIGSDENYILCYFDLDNFKAFNDVYGFRNGDRIIQLFADMLRKQIPSEFFKAHIGGDDFFVASHVTKDVENCLEYISNIIMNFSKDAKEFYTQTDKEQGYILAKNRDGELKQFPFLTVSASVLVVYTDAKHKFKDSINTALSSQKKIAKMEPKHIAVSSLL